MLSILAPLAEREVMQAFPVFIAEYFNGEKQSVIPLFQRPYRWDVDKWEMLWADIMTKYEDATGTARHFMGAIVSLPVTTIPVGVQKHLIIDGQQRLTTVAVVLRALKDFVSEMNKGIIGEFLVNRYREGAERPKLLPTHGDRDVLQRLLNDQTPPDDRHLLIRCYIYFQGKLGGKDDNDIVGILGLPKTV
jgi:Protein of unknown function DUF262